MRQKCKIDTSKDLIVVPKSDGIRLIKPNTKKPGQFKNHSPIFTNSTLDDFFKLGLSFCMYENDGKLVMYNDTFATLSKATSMKSLIDKYPNYLLTKKSSDNLMRDTKLVINKGQGSIAEQHIEHLAGLHIHIISIKFPLRNEDNNIVGIFSCDVPFTLHSIMDVLPNMFKMGIFNWLDPKWFQQKLFFPKREQECLYLLVTGKTIKQIARILKLSPRTVEHYLESVKEKTGTTHRSELIEKAIDMGFVSIQHR